MLEDYILVTGIGLNLGYHYLVKLSVSVGIFGISNGMDLQQDVGDICVGTHPRIKSC